jgi:hypothetical protein
MWLPNDGSDVPKIPSGKAKCLIVLHAGTISEGLIDGCDLVFLEQASIDFQTTQERQTIYLLVIDTIL